MKSSPAIIDCLWLSSCMSPESDSPELSVKIIMNFVSCVFHTSKQPVWKCITATYVSFKTFVYSSQISCIYDKAKSQQSPQGDVYGYEHFIRASSKPAANRNIVILTTKAVYHSRTSWLCGDLHTVNLPSGQRHHLCTPLTKAWSSPLCRSHRSVFL